MKWLKVREKAIVRGIKSVKAHYPDENDPRRLGGIIGFRMCYNLTTYADYESLLTERRDFERKLQATATPEEYKKHRYATLQIEFMMEVLRVSLGMSPLSSRAMRTYESITKRK